MSKLDYIRGSVWWANLPKYQGSSVQSGYRPVVIVSSYQGCLSADMVTVCPFTTKIKDLSVNRSVKFKIDGRDQQVLTNQLITIPKYSLSRPSGYLDKDDLDSVNEGLMLSLGITRGFLNTFKSSQEALAQAKEDKETLLKLIPEAKEILSKLGEIVKRSQLSKNSQSRVRNYTKRTPEEISEFIKEWEDPGNDRHDVASAFNFNSYGAAYNFWANHRKRS